MQATILAPTRSFLDLLLSKGASPPPSFDAMLPPRPPTQLKRSKASSMLDLFSHRRRNALPRERSSSCLNMSSNDDELERAAADTTATADMQGYAPTASTVAPKLKKCASASASLTKSGWGMVPVLNELEQRASFYQHRHRRSRRDSRSACRNCGCLFFTDLSGVTDDTFCSLDCQASHAYVHDMQDVVDLQLDLGDGADSGWSDSSHSTSDSSVQSVWTVGS